MKNSFLLSILSLFIFLSPSFAQVGGWNPNLEEDAAQALEEIIQETPKLKSFAKAAYGYAVFPRVTKAGMGIGGAAGNGVVYKNHHEIGYAKLKQASFGFQFGGQQYIEVIFFENSDSFERFTNGKLKFDAQASAVAITEGASIDGAYEEGVAIFTATRGGLMYEATVGGQHFKYKAKKQSSDSNEF